MTVNFYVADTIWVCPEEDADFVHYEDYKRLEIAARKALSLLEEYNSIVKNPFTKLVIDDLKRELEG